MNATWIVTAYFNPLGWRSRRENFRLFRNGLRDDLPLCVVEWSPDGRFELDDDDAELLVRVSGGDLMWQKERLLNIGWRALPARAESVVFTDCDVLIAEGTFRDAAAEALRSADFAQLFEQTWNLEALDQARLLQERRVPPLDGIRFQVSLLSRVLTADDPERYVADFLAMRRQRLAFSPDRRDLPTPNQEPYVNAGVLWAARKDWLERVGGIFDRFVIGGGDTAIVAGLLGFGENIVDVYAEAGIACYRCAALADWFARVATHRPRLGQGNARIVQLYHGSRADRQYSSRHSLLGQSGIDLDRHLAQTAEGAWAFTGAHPPELPRTVAEYFAARREDS